MNSFSSMSSRVPNVIPDNFKNGSRIVGLGGEIIIYYTSKQPIVPYTLTGLLSTEVVDGNLTGNFTSPNYSTTIFINSDATSTSFTMTTSKRSISIQIVDGVYIVGVSGQLYSANPSYSNGVFIAYEGAARTTYMNIYNNNPATQVLLPGLTNISVTGMTTDNLGNFYFGVNNLGGAICKIDSGGVFSVYAYLEGGEIGFFVNGIVTDESNNVYYSKTANGSFFMKRLTVSSSIKSITNSSTFMSMCTDYSKRNLYAMDKATSRIVTNTFGTAVLNGISNNATGNNQNYTNYTNNIYFNTTSLSTASFFTHLDTRPGTQSKMVIDSSNNFYICQANCIRRAINITGAVSLIAGIPVVAPNSITYNGFDPSGVACIENSVIAIQVDSYNDIYFIDSSNTTYNLKQISYPNTTNRNITILKTFTSNDAPQDMFIRNNLVYVALKYGIVSYPLSSRVVPLSPSSLRILSIASNSATITFEPPAGKILFYLATIGSLSQRVIPGSQISGLSSLLSATSYTLSVVSINATGTSSPSTVLLLTVPAAPTNVNATSTSDSIAVTFNPSTGASSYIATTTSGIVLQPFNSGDYITGLTAGTSYTINILATNASGNSVASSSVIVPVPPTALNVTAFTSTSVTIAFTASTGATSYIAYATAGENAITQVVSSGTAITGLSSNTQYSIVIRARNGGGTSGPSTEVIQTTRSYDITTNATIDSSTVPGYTLYRFPSSSGVLVFVTSSTRTLNASILCVGGGGGGRETNGAGGGGGGGEVNVLSYSLQLSTTTTLNVTVGTGGAGGTYASNGTNTTVQIGATTILSASGGGNGGSTTVPPNSAPVTGGGKEYQVVQGTKYSGGNGKHFAGGGGGGAGGNGSNGVGTSNGSTGYKGGNGGSGRTVSMIGLPGVTYGGGGGGGTKNSTFNTGGGSGGNGGGGLGLYWSGSNPMPTIQPSNNGTANTGGGGGGGAEIGHAGAGGSGYCIISIQN